MTGKEPSMAMGRRAKAGATGAGCRGVRPGTLALVAVLAVSGLAGAGVAADGAGWAAVARPSSQESPAPEAVTAEASGVRPVPGEVVAAFEPPASPYGPGRRGVRLAASAHEAVRAARAGEIAFAGPVAGTPWITVDHGGGLVTTYGPVRPGVRAGQQVGAGAVIGALAESDRDGLHWGARLDGAYLDPLSLLAAWEPVLVPRRSAPAASGRAE
jgi:murein DD-endopeptidase MepM/ murein hydrolase activator NlpD